MCPRGGGEGEEEAASEKVKKEGHDDISNFVGVDFRSFFTPTLDL